MREGLSMTNWTKVIFIRKYKVTQTNEVVKQTAVLAVISHDYLQTSDNLKVKIDTLTNFILLFN